MDVKGVEAQTSGFPEGPQGDQSVQYQPPPAYQPQYPVGQQVVQYPQYQPGVVTVAPVVQVSCLSALEAC